ncbi:MAG: autotransporter-associated beta strand repeat-containing protein [Tepidisphaerales bacterium]
MCTSAATARRPRGHRTFRRRVAVALTAALGWAAVPAARPASAADFWWHGDLSNTWFEAEYNFFSEIINSNWATSASGAVDARALPGPSDLVRFTTGTAQNFGWIWAFRHAVLGIRTEGFVTLDVNLRRAYPELTSYIEVGTASVVVEGSGILRFHELELRRTGTLNHEFNVNNPSGQVWVTGNGDWLSGGRALVKNGPGNMRLAGSNTFTGPVLVNDGTLTLASNGAIPAGRSININRGFLRVSGATATVGNLIFGDGGTTVGPMGTQAEFGGSLILNGGVQFNGGNGTPAAVLQAPMFLPAGTHTLSNPNFTPAIGSYDLILSGPISGPGALVKQNSGFIVVLNAPNTYTGGTTITAGTLHTGAVNALPPGGSVTLNLGSTLDLSTPVTQNGVVAGSYSQTIGTLTGSGAIRLGGAVLTVSDGNYAGPISGTGFLFKQGPGTLVLSGNNSYSGNTGVLGGTLRLGSSTALPASTFAFVGEGTLDLGGFNATVRNLGLGDNNRTGPKNIINSGGPAALTVTRLISYAGVANAVSAPGIVETRIHLAPGPDTLTPGTIDISSGLASGGPYDLIFRGGISGTSAVRLHGAVGPRVVYTAPVTYTGPTTIQTGSVLYLATPNALPANHHVVVNDGRLDLAPPSTVDGVVAGNYNQTIGALSGFDAAGQVHLGSATLTVGDANDTTFPGRISGNGGRLVKQGTAVLSLSGSNSYTGGTEVRGGTLRLGSGAYPPNTDLIVRQGRFELDTRFAVNTAVVRHLQLGDGVSFGPIEVAVVSNVFPVALELTGDISLAVSSATRRANVAVPVRLTPGQHVIDNPTNSFASEVYDLVFTQQISGPGGLTKRGNFTQVALAAVNSYSGPTRLEGGTLVIAAHGALNVDSDLIMSPGTVLQMNPPITAGGVVAGNYNLTIGSLSGSGTIQLGSAILTVGRNEAATPDATFAGDILSGTGGKLLYRGTGTLTLAGLNQYNGGTEIREGTLRIAFPYSFPSGTSLHIPRRGTFDIGGNHLTVGLVTLGFDLGPFGADDKIIVSTHADGSPAGGSLTLSSDVHFVHSERAFQTDPGRFRVPVVLPPGPHTLRPIGSMPFYVFNAYELIFREPVSGPGGLVLEGTLDQPPFDVALAAPSPYTGPTVINNGTLYLAAPNALPNSPVTLAFPGAISLSTESMRSDPDVPFGSFDQTLTSLAGTGGTVQLWNRTLTVGDATSTTFAGFIDGDANARLIKTGTGTLTLSGFSSYRGGTRIDSGTLAIAAPGALPANTDVTVRQGTLHIAAANVEVRHLILGDGTSDGPRGVTSAPGGSITLSGNLSYNGRNTFAAPAIVAVPITLTPGQHLLNNPNGQYSAQQYDLVLTRPLSGPGGLTQSGDTFYVALTAPSTYSGPTTIESGSLFIGANNALPTTTALTLGPFAALVLNPIFTQNGVVAGNYNQRVGSLAGGGFINLGSATLTVGDATSTTYSGVIDGNLGKLVKVGSGTLILTANHLYTGGTTVSGGILQIGNGGTTGSVLGDLHTDATAVFSRSDTVTFSGSIRGTGSLVQAGPGTLRLTGDVRYEGNTTVRNGATLRIDSPLLTRSSTLLVDDESVAILASKRTTQPTLAAELDQLIVRKDALARVTPTDRAAGFAPATLVTSRLLLDARGFIDLTNNDMLVRGEPAERVREYVRAWTIANGGLPGSVGLGSSLAFYPADGAFTTLAVYDNSLPGHFLPLFNGIETTPSDVLVKYTYWGDTDLNGVVDADDLARVLMGLNGEGQGWAFGDVDHDGEVTFFDLGRTLAALRGQGASLGDASAYSRIAPPPGGGSAVPEPASLGLIAAAGPLLARRPRRATGHEARVA